MSNGALLGGMLTLIVLFAYASAAIFGIVWLLVATSVLLMAAAFISGLIKGGD